MVGYAVISSEGMTPHEGGLDAVSGAAERLGEGQCLWVELDEEDEEETADVLGAVGLERLGAERGRRRHPKVDRVGDTYLIVIKTLWYVEDSNQIETGDLVLCTDGRVLVSIRHGEVDPVPSARERIAADAALRAEGAAAVVYALLDRVVDDYRTALEELGDAVDDLEREVFSDSRRDVIARIYSLIRETLEFRDAVKPLNWFATAIRRREASMPVFERSYFREVAGHLLRVEAEVDTYMSLLTTVLSAHQGQIGTWQNEDMRKISAWAALALVPTVIAGIYGMDFEHMPELGWRHAYPVVLTVMVVLCLLLYRGFKRNGWL